MPPYTWFRTAVDGSGEITAASVAVSVWVDSDPPVGGPYDIVILDANSNGIEPAEWQAFTGGGTGNNSGSEFVLYDGGNGVNSSGFIYSAVEYTTADIGTSIGFDPSDLASAFLPVDPENLDPATVCFAAGTLIETSKGLQPIENLVAGDLVRTVDKGFQPVVANWCETRAGVGKHAPVKISQGALENTTDVYVSQNHRILVQNWKADVLFGEPEVLVMAKSMVNGGDITIEDRHHVTYHHLLLKNHELVYCSGMKAETFFVGSYLLREQQYKSLSELMFSDRHCASAETCRPCLTHREGLLLMERNQTSRTAAPGGNSDKTVFEISSDASDHH